MVAKTVTHVKYVTEEGVEVEMSISVPDRLGRTENDVIVDIEEGAEKLIEQVKDQSLFRKIGMWR